MIFKGNIFTPAGTFVPGEVETKDNIITRVVYYDDARFFRNYIIPGLVDVHVHGAMGYDFCDGEEESYIKIAEYEKANGIVAFAAATMTLAEEKLYSSFSSANGIVAFAAATMTLAEEKLEKICECAGKVDVDGFMGIYLEGPFISLNRKGAQKIEYIKKLDSELVNRLDKLAAGRIKYVLTAPEAAHTPADYEAFINSCNRSSDIRFTIGHSDADYDSAMDAFAKGACEVTHMYNAMSAFDKRSPGILGASLDSDAYVELITDNNHVHPAAVRMTFNAFSSDRVILISDSMMATGMEDGEYMLGEQKVFVKDKAARLTNGTLAGSVTNLKDCFLNALKMGVDITKAVKAVTINPARSLRIDDMYGSIEVGKNGELFEFEL